MYHRHKAQSVCTIDVLLGSEVVIGNGIVQCGVGWCLVLGGVKLGTVVFGGVVFVVPGVVLSVVVYSVGLCDVVVYKCWVL